MQLDNSWDQHFSGSYSRIRNINTTFSNNYYIKQEFFKDFTDKVISISSDADATKVLLENSDFQNIFSTSNGGAINVYPNGNYVKSQVCAINCTCKGADGHFSFVSLKKNEHKNCIFYSSFIECPYNSLGRSVSRLIGGNISYKNNNISNIQTWRTPTIYLNSESELNHVTFSSYKNCTATDFYGIAFHIGKYLVEYCSFIDGRASSHFFISEVRGNATIKYSSIVNIKADILVICLSSENHMMFERCLFSNISDITSDVTIINTMNDELLLLNNFLSTAFCDAVYPMEVMKIYYEPSNDICWCDVTSRFLAFFVQLPIILD